MGNDFDLDEFMSETFGENADDDSSEFDATLFEGGDDLGLSDLEDPDLDEDAGDVDELLGSIETGDIDDMDGDDDSDLAELEKEYHITAAGNDVAAGVEPDEIDDEFGDLDEACSTDPELGEGSGGCCDEMGNPLAPLDPDLDARGDQMLASLVTPDFAEAMLTVEEYDDWIESGDAMEAVAEGYLEEGYVQEAAGCELDFYEDADDIFNEGVFAPEGKKYRMTRTARLRQLYMISLQIEARLHNDPGYPKMQKVYAIKRNIKARWHRQYGALAMRRAKRYLKGIMKSKSSGIQKIATRLVGKRK